MPSLTSTKTKGQYPLTVSFSVDASDMATILQYEWIFGDGKSSKEKSPEHVYLMAGTYNGTLTISDQDGNSWSTTFTIYVYDWDLTGEDEGTHVSFTDKCYRLAVTPNQGIGIVEWSGDLPFPEAGIGTTKGFNKKNEAISLILDNRTGQFYRIGLKEIWQDKVGVYGGSEISTFILLKENIGITGEEAMVEHVESHIHSRPFDESYKGQSGYDNYGFRDKHRVNLKIFANGNTDNPVSKLKNIKQYGDLVFGKRVQNKRLQLKIETTTSAFRITRVRQLIQNTDKLTPYGISGVRTESEFQRLFRGMDLWLSRDSKKPIMNRCTGTDLTGSYNSLTTGPDQKSNSALYFGATDYLTVTLSQKTFPSVLSFWVGDISGYSNILQFSTPTGSFYVSINLSTGYYAGVSDDPTTTNNQHALLEWNGTGWVLITIYIDGTNIYIYENGVLKGVIPQFAWLTSYGGATVIAQTVAMSLFDIRRIPRKVSSDAIQWYYDDVINNYGNGGLLPILR